jgi:type IV secretory pathway VirB3-like protein
MGIGISLLLIAAGAILTWAVDVSSSGFNYNAVGVILLVVGGIGVLLSLIFWSSWGGMGDRRETRVVDR